MKILVVDDDADLRISLAAVLSPRFEVLEASNGEEALAVLKRERPCLALLDVSMPGMSGLEVLAAAKAADPALVVVMLTSQQDIEIASKALNLGASEYVTKPFDADYIRAEVARLTGAPEEPSNEKPWRVVL
ncbi:MAG: response regulator [Elusimicrobia bacterium]|nr:response regulator [Elusimicrobiota bacterium]